MFKLWLELADPALEAVKSKRLNPDTFYDINGFKTFIYDINNDYLYVEDGSYTHFAVLELHYDELYELWGNCLYGRFGEINENNYNSTYELEKVFYDENSFPVEIITFWDRWMRGSNETTFSSVKNVDICVNKILNKSFTKIIGELDNIDNEAIVIDCIREPHYAREIGSKRLDLKHYQINGFSFTSEDVQSWMGKLHFLPKMGSEYQKIVNYAKIIKQSNYYNELKDFVDKALPNSSMKKNPWTVAAQDAKIISKGHDLWRGTSEGKIC